MFYNIFRNTIRIAQVEPLDTSELVQQKQLEDYIRLDFETSSIQDLRVGDYIVFPKTEQLYYLNELPEVVERGGFFEYSCKFEGLMHDLKKTRILLDKDFNFPLTGNAKTFLQFIVENLNRTGSGYIVGDYDTTEDLTVDFANWNAFEAITQLSSLLSFSWYLEGKTLNFTSRNQPTPYTLHVGLKKGLVNLTRSIIESKEIYTVIYGYGSTENLPPRTGEGQTYNSPLLMENRLFFIGEDGESKLTKNTDTLGVRESVEIFDIKPERTGTVTGIDSGNVNVIYDTGIEFNINDQKLSEIKPKIQFIDGKLLGITFDISWDDDTKKITLDTFSDESGSYPNDTLFAEIGDSYKLFDIIMPESYITDAETRLEEATQSFLNDHAKSMIYYEGEVDNEWIQSNNAILYIGDTVRIVSPAFQIDKYSEIIGLRQKLTDEYQYDIQFGDELPRGLIDVLKTLNFETKQDIYKISSTQITNNEVTNITGDSNQWL